MAATAGEGGDGTEYSRRSGVSWGIGFLSTRARLFSSSACRLIAVLTASTPDTHTIRHTSVAPDGMLRARSTSEPTSSSAGRPGWTAGT